MSSAAIIPPGDGAPGDGAPGDVRDLDARSVIEAMVASRRAADAHEARVLALAVHFVDLHPVTAQQRAASWDPDQTLPVTSTPRPRGSSHQSQGIAGEGTPGVAEFAVEELGAALAVSYRTALGLVADAVELCYRLPRLWALVQAGRLQAWKARQVAQLTIPVSPAAASFVDRHLAADATRNRVPTVGQLRALVHEALLQHDPDTAAAREEVALHKRGVWFDHRDSTATTKITATLDALDALDLDATVTDLAEQLRRLGDHDPLDVRRARALGTLAHPQHLLDLRASSEPEADSAGAAPLATGRRPVLRPPSSTTAHLYVHVSLADLLTGQRPQPVSPTATVERLGALTVGLVRDWLARCDKVSVRPVLHLTDPDSTANRPGVDQHDPPGWMRESVILRDGHCVFPGCTVDARACDQDHIDPYVPVDEGGPPGQTAVENLACLCRRHHRLKTHTAWRYRRLPDGDYVWTSPTGHTYLSSPTSRR